GAERNSVRQLIGLGPRASRLVSVDLDRPPRPGSTVLARLGVLRQPVVEHDPGKPRARAGVILRRQSARIVEAAYRDVDLARKVGVLEGELRPATAAERPLGPAAGGISHRPPQ